MNSREIILDILLEISGQNEYSNILITAVLNKYDYLEPREKAFIKHVAEGTLERRIQIDYVLDRYSKVPVRKMKPLIRELLRMSVYQILFMENVPDAAVCNEAVKLAKKRRFQTLQGYVNGVLRTIVREKDKIPYPERDKDIVRYFSVCYSMPEWLVRHFQKAYGDEKTEKILQGFLERQPVCVRIDENLEEETRKEILDAWKRDGVKVKSPFVCVSSGGNGRHQQAVRISGRVFYSTGCQLHDGRGKGRDSDRKCGSGCLCGTRWKDHARRLQAARQRTGDRL